MKFSVNRVYDIKNLFIELKQDQNVVILIGPNGSGKTTLLKMFDYVLNLKHFLLFDFEFDIIDIEIGKNKIKICKDVDVDTGDFLKYYLNDIPIGDFKKNGNRDFLNAIRRYSSNRLIQVNDEQFLDARTNKEISIEEVLASLPEHIKAKIISNSSFIPEKVKTIFSVFNVHFVTSDRLEIKVESNTETYYRDSDRQSVKTIEHFSNDLKLKITGILSNYADNSRKIDKDFPQNIIRKISSKQNISKPKLNQIIDEMESISKLIYSSGLLMDDDSSLSKIKLISDDDVTNIVINQYMEDSINKLSSLRRFAEKMNLFKELINSKLRRKKVLINKHDGFYVVNDSSTIVDLKNLSSGEQQQIILFYDLLFQSKENQIYLIDEPEISLHVEWQRSFLSDITKIVGFNKIQVILATHSPQIIGDNWDIAIDFGESNVTS